KGPNDFKKLDNIVIKNMKVNFDEVRAFGEGLDANYINLISNLEGIYSKENCLGSGYFLFNVKVLIESYFKDQYNFEDLIIEMIEDFIKKEYENVIEGYFVEFKPL